MVHARTFIVCSYNWVDDETIVACVIPPGTGEPPAKPRAPLGPKIEDNSSGKKSQARTYPDLLKSPYDEKLFEYYTTSQLVTVSVGLQALFQLFLAFVVVESMMLMCCRRAPIWRLHPQWPC